MTALLDLPDTDMTIEAPAWRKTWTPNRELVWKDRYAADGEVSPEQMWQRVAEAIGDDDDQRQRFHDILFGFRFVPGGRILASAGVDAETVAYNCFVIPVESDTSRSSGNDSRDAIMDTINRMVQIMSRGGGVGINWSTLRPRGSHLVRVNGTSSGAVGWMDVASHAVGEVIQGGSRRGAAMFMLHDWHPDLEEFIDAKRDRVKITNANVSVAVSDEFMEAVKNDERWELIFPDTTHPAYNTEWNGDITEWHDKKGYPYEVYKIMKARDLWRKICEAACDNGEPGVVFLERAQKLSTAGASEKIISVNPCGEQPLGAYSVCNLGSMNLNEYVDDDGIFYWTNFEEDVATAIEFLDNVIDKSHYIEDMPQTRDRQKQLRRVGLGVMGLADALVKQKIRYGSPKAIEFTKDVFRVMKDAAVYSSAQLAKNKGTAKGWDDDMINRPYLSDDLDEGTRQYVKRYGMRNIFLLTQAPTGTTSLVAGASSGIEPYFALEYERNDRLGKRTIMVQPYYEWLNTVAHRVENGVVVDLPDYFVTANELSVEEHVQMQAAAQRYVDSSISKTVNAPNSHTVEDVMRLYEYAYDMGLKGIAYFREGCNRDVVLSRKVEEPVSEPVNAVASPYARPVAIHGKTTRIPTRLGHAFITVNNVEGNGPIECFVNVGRAGSELAEWSETMGRLISLSLRHGASVADVADQLDGVGGYSKFAPSLASGVARALRESVEEVTVEQAYDQEPTNSSPAPMPMMCPECKNFSMVREEGCMKCYNCGNSMC